MEYVNLFLDVILHVDKHLTALIGEYGTLTYAILCTIVFVETGLVVMPFLPGDSLLFAAGAVVAMGALNLYELMSLLILAATVGDNLNYWIGRYLGKRAYSVSWVNHRHLDKAQTFYREHGGKTIILARFVPIIRTFAQFVAGIGHMRYTYFFSFSIVGTVTWVLICTLAGYFFGNIPIVKKNFELVILAIIFVSLLPVMIEVWKAKRQKADE